MTHQSILTFRPSRLSAALALAAALAAAPVAAQSSAPTDNATINLIRLLVEQGVLKKDQADALVKQAVAEAAQVQTAASAGGALAQPGDVRVPYIPETVRDQIRDEVRTDVMAQAKAENWAQPNTFPDWVSRITVEGDVRVRGESRGFNSGNSNEVIDFAKLNAKGPYDVNTNTSDDGFPPILNTRQDRRNLARIRARLGVRADISDKWTAGIRLATGSDDSPVSTTQTLGGGMGKKDIWLDQAYITYRPANWATLTGGRIGNPFDSTDLLYSGDLNFDGAAAIFKHPLPGRDVTVFGTLGAFATEYANSPWTSSEYAEGKSENKWLLGGQLGAEWKIDAKNSLRGAVAYYHFDNIAGKRSSPCSPWAGDEACDTDWSRPAFMQKGNTLFLLRDIMPNPADPAKTVLRQFVGLASEFNLLDLNLRWDARVMDGMGLRLSGNYVRNLAYKESKMWSRSAGQIVTNLNNDDQIESGPNAWMLHAALGNGFDLREKGDWQVFAGYKYIQPDAMPDGYNDSTFHLGGTNARGYYLGGSYAFDKNVYGALRWSSSKEIYGAPMSIDVVQLEVNARF
ncbi:putative porin [Pollutimonas bauzanensis]|uniref:Putative porin n=1 Tax=Pollutimonas bauzanensis TaxID=658167 RepID=A0A1M5ZN16_9BURK|nr:putative porin [Pollutimonas bauzanensis]SHI25303.1 Putative porin [Pollutimonas bauzanensis]